MPKIPSFFNSLQGARICNQWTKIRKGTDTQEYDQREQLQFHPLLNIVKKPPRFDQVSKFVEDWLLQDNVLNRKVREQRPHGDRHKQHRLKFLCNAEVKQCDHHGPLHDHLPSQHRKAARCERLKKGIHRRVSWVGLASGDCHQGLSLFNILSGGNMNRCDLSCAQRSHFGIHLHSLQYHDHLSFGDLTAHWFGD